MIRALWRRWVAGLRSRPWQTAVLLLVVTIAATGITAGLDQQRGAAARWDEVFGEVNGAHVVVYSSQGLALDEIADDPVVAETAGPFHTIDATLIFGAVDSDLDIRGIGPTLPTITKPLLTDGRWLVDDDRTGIVLDRAFALDRGISVGDQIRIVTERGDSGFEVVGLAVDTVDCLYPQCDPGRSWALPSVLDEIGGEDEGVISMIRVTNPADAPRFAGELQGRYPEEISFVLDWQDTRDDVLVTNLFFGLFLAIFGAVLLGTAGLVVASTVTARMFAKYREIGLLKSIGFTPRSLTAFTMFENLAIGLVGTVFGWLAGALLAPALQLRIAEVLDPGGAGLSAGSLLITAVIVLSIIAVSTALPAWRAGRVPTSQAITRGSAPPGNRPSIAARAAGRVGFGPVGMTGIKNAFARPFRTIFTIATLTLSVLAGVIAIGMNATIDAITTDPARTGDPWDVLATTDALEPAELEAILDTTPEVANWYSAAQRGVADDHGTITARALGGDLESTSFKIGAGRMLAAADEAVVGHALLDRLGIEVGDRATVTLSGESVTFTVVGWFATMEDSGEILLFHLDGLRNVEANAQPSGWFAEAAPDTTTDELSAALADATNGQATLRILEPFDDLDAFQVAFAIITVLVLMVGLVNLISSTMQMMQERTRDVAVLKAIGFTPRQVITSVVLGASALAVASVLIGGLLAVPLYTGLMDSLGVALGAGPGFGVSPGVVAVIALLAFIVAATAAFAALAARRPARANVADVLRDE